MFQTKESISRIEHVVKDASNLWALAAGPYEKEAVPL